MSNNAQIRIDNELVITKEYMDFIGTPPAKAYFFLLAYVIRKNPKKGTGAFKLYENYYQKGKLASRWSQEDIAEYFEVSQPTVSRMMTKIVKLGYVKIDKVKVHNKVCNVYILGKHDGDGLETLFLEEVIRNNAVKKKRTKAEDILKKFENENY